MAIKNSADLLIENDSVVTDQTAPETITPATLGGVLNLDIIESMYNRLDDDPATGQNTVENPTGMTGGTMLLMGLGCAFTPGSSGLVLVSYAGEYTSAFTGNNTRINLWTGTGAPPANGATASTAPGAVQRTDRPLKATSATDRMAFAGSTILTLVKGTTYWIDLGCSNNNNSAVQLFNVSLTALEKI